MRAGSRYPEVLIVRVSGVERAIVERAATAYGATVAAVMRQAIVAAVPKLYPVRQPLQVAELAADTRQDNEVDHASTAV